MSASPESFETRRSKEHEPEPGSYAVVFSGQGVTKLTDVYDYADQLFEFNPDKVRQNLEWMGSVSSFDLLSNYQNRSTVPLENTHVLQVTIHALHLTAIEMLQEKGMLTNPSDNAMVAGFSGGEMAAMVASGALDAVPSGRVVSMRGEIYHRQAKRTPSGLFLPLGLGRSQVENIVSQTQHFIAVAETGMDFRHLGSEKEVLEEAAKERGISAEEFWKLLCSDKNIIAHAIATDSTLNVPGGTEKILSVAKVLSKAEGARRIMPVNAEVAFHTPATEQADEEFLDVLLKTPIKDAKYPISLNDGTVTTVAERIIDGHISRFTRTSEWSTAVGNLKHVEHVIKVGPGGVVPGVSESNGIREDRQTTIVAFLQSP